MTEDTVKSSREFLNEGDEVVTDTLVLGHLLDELNIPSEQVLGIIAEELNIKL